MTQSNHRKVHTPKTETLVETLVSECRDPARLLELYYWSTEPELLPIIRGFASLPSGTRALLEAFLRTTDTKSVSAEIKMDGRICLTPEGDRPLA
jgi:hypothetical protein